MESLFIKYHTRITHKKNFSLSTPKRVYIPQVLAPLQFIAEHATITRPETDVEQISLTGSYKCGQGTIVYDPTYYEIKVSLPDQKQIYCRALVKEESALRCFFKVERDSYMYGRYDEDEGGYVGTVDQKRTCLLQLLLDLFVFLVDIHDLHRDPKALMEYAGWYKEKGRDMKSHKNRYEKVIWFLACDIICKYNTTN